MSAQPTTTQPAPIDIDWLDSVHLDQALIRMVINEHLACTLPRFEQLWNFYRNPTPTHNALSPQGGLAGGVGVGGGGVALGQEAGLPARLRPGRRDPSLDDRAPAPEIVIENDIAWRLHAMIDLLFGRPLKVQSQASDSALKRDIEHALEEVWERSGGRTLFHDLALLGHVYGHADLIVRENPHDPSGPVIEPIDPCQGIPIQDPSDYRRLHGYIIRSRRSNIEIDKNPKRNSRGGTGERAKRTSSEVLEIYEPGRYRLFENDHLLDERPMEAFEDRLPIVHLQNLSQPFAYSGLSEVEPLIPLQNELNTRLSDRASRVTLQSFRMYLAKGIDGFHKMPIGPGQVFSTDNMAASIQPFGGDSDAPSEQAHIDEIREAMDKASGIPPVATGVVRGKVGNLSSENALRLTLVGALAKNERKRATYGRAIVQASELALAALHHAGVLRTKSEDRRLRIEWPGDPLPVTFKEEVELAKAKISAGVPAREATQDIRGGAGDTRVE